MFARNKRLPRATFGIVAAAKTRAATMHFSYTASRAARGYAVVVSKKVAKSSVARHALKRRTLAYLAGQNLPPALIVYARAGAPTLSPAALRLELAAGLAKIA